MLKTEIMPKKKLNVMDLITVAGIDTSDWKNYKKGEEYAASNPKYCYEWSFVEKGKVVVLNLWYHNIIEKGNDIVLRTNMREVMARNSKAKSKQTVVKRAHKMDQAIQTALQDKLPIRVIICKKRNTIEENNSDSISKVHKRELDSAPWGILSYNTKTGECILKRGLINNKIIDQYSMDQLEGSAPVKKDVIASVFERDSRVRRNVRNRSNGKCEKCGKIGFFMKNYNVYIETHHITPLNEGGVDNESNVIALCPDHHKEAHYGINNELFKKELEEILRLKGYKIKQRTSRQSRDKII